MGGAITAIREMASNTADIGRDKKINPLPWERVSDWRNVFSKSGPRTRPSTIGAADQS